MFVLRAGVAFIEKGLADFLYLSLTDYMQHTYSPETEESLAFYEAMDKEIGAVELGAIVGATADHGMNAKVKADGSPNVLFVEDMLEAQIWTKWFPRDLPYHRSLCKTSWCIGFLCGRAYK